MQVLVSPVRLRMLLDPYAPAVIMIVSGGDQDPLSPATIARLFGLTRKEARLVVVLMQGKDLTVAAEELAIAYETARKHLQSIFQKLGVRRQSELVRVVVSGVASIRMAAH